MSSRRIEEERQTVRLMIGLFCRNRHGGRALCPSCAEVFAYAAERLARCRFGAKKPTCQKCPVHCYRPDMRDKIRQIMRYAGPKMMFHHPKATLRHLLR
ncbi:MAG: nitrous oxide-stimulated promoter family protein [Prevotellaceae bacterium]|nr:nitrous oxide-stimulated promoter family protein [Prevotellaceae bacterium]